MLIQKLNCPYGCQNTTFAESVKQVNATSENLLLDGGNHNINSTNSTSVKVYTCNCCSTTFEIPVTNTEKKHIL